MPIIDGHIHLWSHDMTRYPDIAWRDDGNGQLPREDDRAARTDELMDAAGVACARNVRVPSYRDGFRVAYRE